MVDTIIGKKLVIISHTEHWSENNKIKGWAPTVNEIDHLASFWGEVVHLAPFHNGFCPKSSITYSAKNVRIVPLPFYGGKIWKQKISIITTSLTILKKVRREVADADYVQLRMPTSMGLYLLPFFSWFSKRNYKLWVKYAGNWNHTHPPLASRIIRWFLISNFANCKVTINGNWPNQPKHCLTFENPCLSLTQIIHGRRIAQTKKISPPYKLIFVGRLEAEKGISRIFAAINDINPLMIKEVIFIGDGSLRAECQEQAARTDIKIRLEGYQNTEFVHKELEDSHFILLPSDSEGFPKVIAEAANYGCIPIVSDVSCISQYVNNRNGFLWNPNSGTDYSTLLTEVISSSIEDLLEKKNNITKLALQFSFEAYTEKLRNNVI